MPVSRTASARVAQTVVVTVDSGGRCFLDRDPIERLQIVEALRARIAASPNITVVINCDKSQPVAVFASVFDLVKQANPATVMVATTPQRSVGGALAMRMQQPQLRRARIEIIPMIDTIFFLLVFFMVTWLSLVKMNGLNLLLPRHNQSSSKPLPAITLSVSPSGRYYLDKNRLAPDAWQTKLKQQLQRHPASAAGASQVVVINVAPHSKNSNDGFYHRPGKTA